MPYADFDPYRAINESVNVFIFTTKYSVAFTVPIFTKLAAIQQFYVDIPCTELHPNWTKM